MRFPALESGLDVLCLAEAGFRDCFTVLGLRKALTSEWAKAELRFAEVPRLEERVLAAEEDSEALCVARLNVAELMADHASLTT